MVAVLVEILVRLQLTPVSTLVVVAVVVVTVVAGQATAAAAFASSVTPSHTPSQLLMLLAERSQLRVDTRFILLFPMELLLLVDQLQLNILFLAVAAVVLLVKREFLGPVVGAEE